MLSREIFLLLEYRKHNSMENQPTGNNQVMGLGRQV